jgi:hypothetical protein
VREHHQRGAGIDASGHRLVKRRDRGGNHMKCETCEYYDPEEGICGAFECNGTDCPTLPCEET